MTRVYVRLELQLVHINRCGCLFCFELRHSDRAATEQKIAGDGEEEFRGAGIRTARSIHTKQAIRRGSEHAAKHPAEPLEAHFEDAGYG